MFPLSGSRFLAENSSSCINITHREVDVVFTASEGSGFQVPPTLSLPTASAWDPLRTVGGEWWTGGSAQASRNSPSRTKKTYQIIISPIVVSRNTSKPCFLLKDFYNTCGSPIKNGKNGKTEKTTNSNRFHHELTCSGLELPTKHHSPIETVWIQL